MPSLSRKFLIAATALMATVALTLPSPVHAAPAPDALDELVRLNPGATAESMRAAAEEWALDRGITVEQALTEALAAQSTAAPAPTPAPARAPAARALSSSGTGGTVTLTAAARVGDIFHEPAWPANHVAIYNTTAQITEAVGGGVRVLGIGSRKVNPGAKKYAISTTQPQRNAAASWARARVGASYNPHFAFNKNNPAVTAKTQYNCSQLIWAAYLNNAGIDLDANGGPGVYPDDIRNSPHTSWYANL